MPFNATLWVLKESQIEGCKHQNDSDVHHQSFPEMVPEDQGIYSDDDGYHRHHVRHGNHRSCHCDLHWILRFEFQITQDSSCAQLVAAGATSCSCQLYRGSGKACFGWCRSSFGTRSPHPSITSWKGCFCCQIEMVW